MKTKHAEGTKQKKNNVNNNKNVFVCRASEKMATRRLCFGRGGRGRGRQVSRTGPNQRSNGGYLKSVHMLVSKVVSFVGGNSSWCSATLSSESEILHMLYGAAVRRRNIEVLHMCGCRSESPDIIPDRM